MTKLIEINITSELYVAGRGEDGEEFQAEVYFLVAEYTDGQRKAHIHRFKGCEVVEYDDQESGEYGTSFKDTRAEAMEKATNLLNLVRGTVAQGGELGTRYWKDYYSVYGTNAYLNDVSQMSDEERSQ